MPTYGYECKKCGHNFDAFQKINDSPLENCPKCKGKLRRLIFGGTGIIFKGSGFYATDYRKDKDKKSSYEPKKNDSLPVCPKIKEGCSGCSQAKNS